MGWYTIWLIEDNKYSIFFNQKKKYSLWKINVNASAIAKKGGSNR